MFKIQITARAKRHLKNISKIYQQQAINNAFEDLKEEPDIGKPLNQELIRKFSYTVGVFRIIYLVDYEDKTIKILNARHRLIVYQRKS